MRTISSRLVALNLALVLGIACWQIIHKERLMAHGRLVLLPLAPVDPLSLMQGYYMDLRYEAVQHVWYDSIPARGCMVVALDSGQVGRWVRTQDGPEPLGPDELPIRYFYNDRFVSIGAEAYFFQEGQDSVFAAARYGGLRVDPSGESVLVGLYDDSLRLIVPPFSNF
jgi:uncharacterized membrane-anchored protein